MQASSRYLFTRRKHPHNLIILGAWVRTPVVPAQQCFQLVPNRCRSCICGVRMHAHCMVCRLCLCMMWRRSQLCTHCAICIFSADGAAAGVGAQTAAMSVGVGTACTLYEPLVVLEALVLTASITLSLTAYTFYAARKGQSFQKLGPMLFTCARLAGLLCLPSTLTTGSCGIHGAVGLQPVYAFHSMSGPPAPCMLSGPAMAMYSVCVCAIFTIGLLEQRLPLKPACFLWRRRHACTLLQVCGRSSPGPSSRSCSRCRRSARPSLRSLVRTCQRCKAGSSCCD